MASRYKHHSIFTRNKSLTQVLSLSLRDREEGSCEDRACDFPRKRRTVGYKSRRDTGVNVRGRALQQATTVTTLLKRRESSFVWYFRYIKPRICDSGAEFGLAKLHFTARGRIPGYINLPREHREEKEITRVLASLADRFLVARRLHASPLFRIFPEHCKLHKRPGRIGTLITSQISHRETRVNDM